MSDDDRLFYGNDAFFFYNFTYGPSETPTSLASPLTPSETPSVASIVPSEAVTLSPTTLQPSVNSTDFPTASPRIATISPTTVLPTMIPSAQPTVEPSLLPTEVPTYASTVSLSTAMPTSGINSSIANGAMDSHHHSGTQIAIIVLGLFVAVCVLVALILRFHERKDRTAARRSNIRYAEYLGEDFDHEMGGGQSGADSYRGLVQMQVSGSTGGMHSSGTWARPPPPTSGGSGAGGTGVRDVPTAIGVIGGQSVRRSKYSVVDPAKIDQHQTAVEGAEYLTTTEKEDAAAAENRDGWSMYATGNPMNPFK